MPPCHQPWHALLIKLESQNPSYIEMSINACSWLRQCASQHVRQLRLDVGVYSWDFLEESIRDAADGDFTEKQLRRQERRKVEEFYANRAAVGLAVSPALAACTRLTALRLDEMTSIMDWDWLSSLPLLQSIHILHSDDYAVTLGSELSAVASLQEAHLEGFNSPLLRLPPSLTKLHWDSLHLPVRTHPREQRAGGSL